MLRKLKISTTIVMPMPKLATRGHFNITPAVISPDVSLVSGRLRAYKFIFVLTCETNFIESRAIKRMGDSRAAVNLQ